MGPRLQARVEGARTLTLTPTLTLTLTPTLTLTLTLTRPEYKELEP